MSSILCSMWLCAGYANDKVVNIADFMKYVREGDDVTPVVTEALKYCRKVQASKLLFPKATYNFKKDFAVEKYHFISNNDEGLKRFVFDLSGIKNLEIDGQGSLFLLNGFLSPFLLDKSSNITFRNFSIDYSRTFHSEGKILKVDNNGIDIQFSSGFPYKIDNTTLLFTDKEGTVYPWSDLLEFDPQRRETAFMAKDLWVGSKVPVKEISPGVVRLKSPDIKGTVGNVMVFAAGHRLVPAFNISSSNNIRFFDVNIYHCGGMGVIAQNSSNIYLDKVKVSPAPGSGRIISITADATHFSNCTGKVVLENCLFENQKDDASNIHGIYSRITRVISPNEIEVKLVHRQQFGFDYLEEGMELEFADGPSIKTYSKNTIKSLDRINKEYTRVTLRQPLDPATKSGDVIASINGYPEVLIRNCVIRGNRARGILLNSRGTTIVENNVFHVPGAAILFEGDASFWYEQSGVNNVIIRNNTFDNCNYGVWGTACIEVGSGIVKEYRANNSYHKNIVIENNVFKVFDPRILKAYSVDGLVFRSNKIERSNDYKSLYPNAEPFVVDDCSGVQIENL
ncbi:right-handed parallel beta-helix repeat-containing protein [Desertivirga xinjiangensis]|uniref:right-handed parallel beta-helix repeat-containing protein n=1 Tax=Desertivirga xinjiangensis TaxID=539206 RepID=UPI00210C1E8F|nr:right-handed parallel beta-helix repeat-containing protein [Pedobacter xinjiangensis]